MCVICVYVFIFLLKNFFWLRCMALGGLSSLTRDRAYAPNSKVQSFNHWTAREVTAMFFFFSHEGSEAQEVEGLAQGHTAQKQKN